MTSGKVYLVGAGPGDAQLITVKGIEIIKKADVILYDRLVNPTLLEFAPSHCEFIYCGKLPKHHTLRQEAIHAQLIAKAKEGKTVVRLKGGDPGVFGRVGEEAEELVRNGISFEIVPGVTSGIAAPLYAGIPVTHRQYGQSFAFVAAHSQFGDGTPIVDWESLAKGIDTIAFYMGISNLPLICENLMKYGKNGKTPVVLIQWGTLGRQRTLEGTLMTIAKKAKAAQFSNPAIILVGDIVTIRKKISWFEKKRLFGKQILFVRSELEQNELVNKLIDEGADVVQFPKWKIVRKKADPNMLSHVETCEKLLFTTKESVHFFFDTLRTNGIDIRRIQATIYASSLTVTQTLSDYGIVAKTFQAHERFEKGVVIDPQHMNVRGTYNTWITHTKEYDHSFTPVFSQMIKDMNINTIIFPDEYSVRHLISNKEQVPKDVYRLLSSARIFCMEERAKDILEQIFGFSCEFISNEGILMERIIYDKQVVMNWA